MTFAGESVHRCKCFGEGDGRDGAWAACPPDLCEADTLLAALARMTAHRDALQTKLELRIEDDAVYRVYDEQVTRAEAAEASLRTEMALGEQWRTERLAAEADAAKLREALAVIAEQQPQTLRMIEANGFVFDSIGREPGNWQHLAFSIYTDLCEVDTLARAALDLAADGEASTARGAPREEASEECRQGGTHARIGRPDGRCIKCGEA